MRIRRPLWPVLIGVIVLALELVYHRGFYVVREEQGHRLVERVEGARALRSLPIALRGRASWRPTAMSLASVVNNIDYTAAPFPLGLDFLGSGTCTDGAGSSCGVLVIPPRDYLVIIVKVTGYGGGDIESLRFNADAGANYWDRALVAAAGVATFTNTQTISTTLCRLATGDAITTARVSTVFIINKATLSKRGVHFTGDNTSAAATAGNLIFGGCEWVNTTAQITTVELLTAAAATFNADTEFGVFGRNL